MNKKIPQCPGHLYYHLDDEFCTYDFEHTHHNHVGIQTDNSFAKCHIHPHGKNLHCLKNCHNNNKYCKYKNQKPRKHTEGIHTNCLNEEGKFNV